MRSICFLTLALTARLATAATPVLVIDEGADLAHPRLSQFLNTNALEYSGQRGVDDDNDGFTDDVLGWNVESNNGDPMSPKLMEIYQKNKASLENYFALYSKIENNDAQAIAAWKKLKRNDPKTYQVVVTLLEKSHGTHVSGIVADNSFTTARLQSLNALSPSAEEGSGRPLAFLRAFAEIGPTAVSAPKEFSFGDFLNDSAQVKQYLARQNEDEAAAADLISRYVVASGSRVANLSLGSSMKLLRQNLEQLWTSENTRLGRPATFPRSTVQNANFEAFLTGLFQAIDGRWNTVFGRNPDVLFVVAAGNYTDDNDAIAISPSNGSTRFSNVISVAATDKDGLITDFSNFGAKSVNIGAWGKAVNSLAPAGMQVVMSGTSMAAPLVAGVAAKIRDLNPRLTAAQVRQLIERTGRKVGSLSGKTTSGAMIDPPAALAAAVQGNARIGLLSRSFGGLDLSQAARDGTEGLVSQTNEIVRDLLGRR